MCALGSLFTVTRTPYVHLNFQPAAAERRVGAADIVRTVIAERAAGRLPPGARLPPVRVLEHQLGISKNTVQAAYDELSARGVLVAREREGVFVAAGERPAPPRERERSAPAPRFRDLSLPPHRRPAPDVLALSMVFIDPELLPRDRIAECFRSVLRVPGLHSFYDAQGYPPLRAAIARRLAARGMDVAPDEIVVTTGSQQALDAVVRALALRRIATEDPVYPQAQLLFRSLGAELLGLRLDPFQPVPLDEWRAALGAARPELFYLITNFHNPTGHCYSSYELGELLDMARELDIALLEDDWGSDMLSHTGYRPSLRALGGSNVLYVNSFTKKLLPSLRVGFVAGSRDNVGALVAAKRVATLGNPTLVEAALAELLERGYYDTHLLRLHAALDERYTRALAALDQLMPEGVRWTTPGGGPLIWLELPGRIDLAQLAARLLERNVHINPMREAFHGAPHLHGLPIGYAYLDTPRLVAGLEVLAEEIDRAGKAGEEPQGIPRK